MTSYFFFYNEVADNTENNVQDIGSHVPQESKEKSIRHNLVDKYEAIEQKSDEGMLVTGHRLSGRG